MRRICTNSPSGRLTLQDQEIPGRQKSGVGDVESFDFLIPNVPGAERRAGFPPLVRAVMAARAAGETPGPIFDISFRGLWRGRWSNGSCRSHMPV